MNNRFNKINDKYVYFPESSNTTFVIEQKGKSLQITVNESSFIVNKRDIKRLTAILELAAEDL